MNLSQQELPSRDVPTHPVYPRLPSMGLLPPPLMSKTDVVAGPQVSPLEQDTPVRVRGRGPGGGVRAGGLGLVTFLWRRVLFDHEMWKKLKKGKVDRQGDEAKENGWKESASCFTSGAIAFGVLASGGRISRLSPWYMPPPTYLARVQAR
ncbi:hypothetical protein LXA43DRAFT_1059129 [Ganoderma leucocontextum]|nr:hypothetical protein LXA43DRAFT_1059129 [Ganoderma leucocontextum]